jgi:uncharacterized protein (DUF433 family)
MKSDHSGLLGELAMQLEDYFEVEQLGDIRIKGHRIWIQHVLYEYVYNRRTAEEIQRICFPSLSLDKVYATILYYLRDKERINQYLLDWMEGDRNAREDDRRNRPEFYERWRKIKEERAQKSAAS